MDQQCSSNSPLNQSFIILPAHALKSREKHVLWYTKVPLTNVLLVQSEFPEIQYYCLYTYASVCMQFKFLKDRINMS